MDHRLIYLHGPDPRTTRVRGKAAFEMWDNLGWDVQTGTDLQFHLRDPTYMLVTNPASPLLITQLENAVGFRHFIVAIDYTGPVLTPEHILPVEHREWWAHPERQIQLRRAMRIADVLVTPSIAWGGAPEWWAELLTINPNVEVIPDIEDDIVDSKLQFANKLMRAWTIAERRKNDRPREQ